MRLPFKMTWLTIATAVTACTAERHPLELELQILGSRASLERYDLRSGSLSPSGSLVSKDNGLERDFAATLPLGHATSTFQLEAWAAGARVDRVTVKPFVCAERADFAARQQAGWRFKETHQIYLSESGTFDLSLHPVYGLLSHSCTAEAPGGGGEGSATFLSDRGTCSGPGYEGTSMILDYSKGDLSAEVAVDTCYALATQHYGPRAVIFGMTFGRTPMSPEIGLQIGLCLDSVGSTAGDTVLHAGSDFGGADCPLFSGFTSLSSEVGLSGGTVSIAGLEVEGKDAHLELDVTLTGGSAEAARLAATGHLRVPVLRDATW